MSNNENNTAYCIILTRYRLHQGLALYRSLTKNSSDPRICFLCIDDETFDVLSALKLKNAFLIKLSDIETKELAEIRSKRKLNEYCWTLKPVFMEFLMKNVNKASRVTYLDADLYFYSDPERIYKDASQCTVLLTKHDYSPSFDQVVSACGKYNSGFVSVKNNHHGIACVRWWKDKCMDWCSETPQNGRYGDQKYLDFMAFNFQRVCNVIAPGVNIAPWNQSKYRFSEKDGKVFVNDWPLIFYHFSGLRLKSRDEIAIIAVFGGKLIPEVYRPYLRELQEAADEIEGIYPQLDCYIEDENSMDKTKVFKIDGIM